MPYNHKYTESDVRADPFLLAAAVKYARSYTGDFDYLVAAADIVHLRGTLPVAIAKGVLNCMRADPRVADDLPEPLNGHSEALRKFEFTPRQIRLPAPQRTTPRVRAVRVKTIVNRMYTWSAHESIDLETPDKFHFTSLLSHGVFYTPKMDFELFIVSLCGVVRSSKYIAGNNPPANRELCGSCDRQARLPRSYLVGIRGPQNITLASDAKPVNF